MLAGVDLDASRIEPVLGGWASWTFDVDGTWIVRFPRNKVTANAVRRELALLLELAEHVSFAVPRPTHRGAWRSRPFFTYRRIPGRGLRRTYASPAVARVLAKMLAELHGFPVDQAALLLEAGDPDHAWRRRYEELWPEVAEKVLPLLDGQLADEVRRSCDGFLAAPLDFPSCLVHNDLGPEHVLLHGVDGREPSGLIASRTAGSATRWSTWSPSLLCSGPVRPAPSWPDATSATGSATACGSTGGWAASTLSATASTRTDRTCDVPGSTSFGVASPPAEAPPRTVGDPCRGSGR